MVALCGGVGGAKLAEGLADILAPEALTIVVNTADDFQRYGLYISPDVDTVLYTLAGMADPATGWGIAEDTDRVMSALREMGDDAWFQLGDRDLATHLLRTDMLAAGLTLTEVTRRLARGFGVSPTVLPMADGPVSTVIATAGGELPFQEWFVHRRCAPPATGLRYEGAAAAAPPRQVEIALDDAAGIILCPSNPYLSIGPILAVGGMTDRLRATRAPVVAVSPIVGGQALKGPAARMLADLAGEASSRAVARLYADFLDGLAIDRVDADQRTAIETLGPLVLVTDTVMRVPADRVRLANEVLGFVHAIRSAKLSAP